MKIRLNKAHFPVTTLGYGHRLGLWVQGCGIGCGGCVSRDTWDPRGGWDADVAEVLAWCGARRAHGIDGVTVTGGEPFEQPRALAGLLRALDAWRRTLERPFDLLCYSGLPLGALRRRHPDVLALLDVLIPEPYVAARRGAVAGRAAPPRWRGSGNQPLVPLTPLGRARYAGADEAQHGEDAERLQVSLEHGAVWFIGIPGPGDLERLEARARARGVVLEDVSWRA